MLKNTEEILVIVYMIGNAHLDPVWLWRWPEGFNEMISTCRSMVELLKEFKEEVVFTRGEAAMYQWIERVDPFLFEKISELVHKGRWNIVNGWWTQPDCNIPNGESFVRQALYGKSFFKEKFSVEPSVGYCVDSFGHAGTLPQILSKSGYGYYIFMRPGPHEKKLPSTFLWKSPDGSEVITFRVSHSYTTQTNDLTKQINAALDDMLKGMSSTMCFYGVGNHGGGPTRKQIEYIKKHRHFKSGVELKFSSVEKYFKEAENHKRELPVVQDELQYHAIGCYSVNSEIKMLNRKCENVLQSAEKWATLASVIEEVPYPYFEFRDTWQILLFNQFHDTLGGTAIREAYEDVRNQLGGVLYTAKRIIHESIQRIVKNIDIQGEGIPFIVFNPSAFWREECIEFEPWLGREPWGKREIVDSFGNSVPYQRTFPSAAVRNVYRILLKVKIPPLGYNVYWLKKRESNSCCLTDLLASKKVIENSYYSLSISDEGHFLRLYNKQHHREIFGGISNRLLVLDDESDTWSHGISHYSRDAEVIKNSKIELVENGQLRLTVKITLKYGNSMIIQYLSMYRDDPVIRMHFLIDWHEKHKILKLSYQLPKISKIFAEAPYGETQRDANGQEYPMQRALFLEGPEGGVLFANDGKYSYDVLENELRLTLLRSAPYAWHDPYRLKKNHSYFYTDQGIQEFDFWMWDYLLKNKCKGWRYAKSLNSPLEILNVSKHPGKLPSSYAFLEVRGENVYMETLKLSENGDRSMIIRVWETAGKSGKFALHVLGKKQTFEIGCYEIKTIRISDDIFEEVDLMENRISKS